MDKYSLQEMQTNMKNLHMMTVTSTLPVIWDEYKVNVSIAMMKTGKCGRTMALIDCVHLGDDMINLHNGTDQQIELLKLINIYFCEMIESNKSGMDEQTRKMVSQAFCNHENSNKRSRV
jgi:hypothetical protein